MAEPEVHDKLLPLDEAVRTLIPDGCRLRSCGIGLRKPMALTYELIRQRKRDLTFILSGWTEGADMLTGAGCLRDLEGSYLGLEAFGLAHAYRRAVEKGIPHPIAIEEYSNFGMTMRFMAASMGLPFMPIRSELGSDLRRVESFLHPKAHVMDDPFGSGAKVALLPACHADVAVLHAQRCDADGNTQVWGQLGDDLWGPMGGEGDPCGGRGGGRFRGRARGPDPHDRARVPRGRNRARPVGRAPVPGPGVLRPGPGVPEDVRRGEPHPRGVRAVPQGVGLPSREPRGLPEEARARAAEAAEGEQHAQWPGELC